MSKIQERVMRGFYRDAQGDPTRLPWHHDTPSPFLARAIEAAGGTGRALDVGCGAGIFAAQMAGQGLQVTAIDYQPDAIVMARAQAEQRGVAVELIETDVFDFKPAVPYRLVFDSGCLHNFSGRELMDYRARLLDWLEPGEHYVLGHWSRRHFLDWRPIGPRRRTEKELSELLAPELEPVDSEFSDEKVPLPFGPTVRMASYWFKRSGSPR